MRPTVASSGCLAATRTSHSQQDVPSLDSTANISRLVDFADGDTGLAHELAQMFLESDYAALERAAHTMKGTLDYFSNGEAVDLARRLQEMGTNQDLSAAAETMQNLEASIQHLTPSLQEFVRAHAS